MSDTVEKKNVLPVMSQWKNLKDIPLYFYSKMTGLVLMDDKIPENSLFTIKHSASYIKPYEREACEDGDLYEVDYNSLEHMVASLDDLKDNIVFQDMAETFEEEVPNVPSKSGVTITNGCEDFSPMPGVTVAGGNYTTISANDPNKGIQWDDIKGIWDFGSVVGNNEEDEEDEEEDDVKSMDQMNHNLKK